MSAIKRVTAIVLVLTMLILCSCQSGSTGEATEQSTGVSREITVTDMIGRSVKIVPGSYKRAVCIGSGALRMFSYVCPTELLCGVEDIDNLSLSQRPKMFDRAARPYVIAFGEEFKSLPSCGVGGPNAQAAEGEKILSCNPDIVISEFEDVDKENALQQQLGVPVITLKSGKQGVFDSSFAQSLMLLGKVFSTEERAASLIKFIEAEKEEIHSRTRGIPEEDKPSVYICGLGNWGTSNHLMTAENYVSFEVANIKNALSGTKIKGMQSIEAEKLAHIGTDTDIMIIDASAVKNIKPLYSEDNTMFHCMKAWQNDRVYLQMAFNAYYTNYEIALINTWFIAKTVYPELFKDIDITEKTNAVTKAFLGKELAEEIFAYPDSFGGYGKIDTATFFAD